jgi:hypothetical protein
MKRWKAATQRRNQLQDAAGGHHSREQYMKRKHKIADIVASNMAGDDLSVVPACIVAGHSATTIKAEDVDNEYRLAQHGHTKPRRATQAENAAERRIR